MLQSLDTLISFVVILLVASLIVTILVQILSAAFALRGKNLGNALALTFQSIDRKIGKNAYALAERILSDPRLTHSTITKKRLDRPLTASQRCPWSWWSPFNGLQLASAIRSNEIYDLLKKISEPSTPVGPAANAPAEDHTNTPREHALAENQQGNSTPPVKPAIDALKKGANNDPPKKKRWTEDDLGSLARKLLDKLGEPVSMIEDVNKEFSALDAQAAKISAPNEKIEISNALNKAQASLKGVSANFKSEVDELNKWFTASQDRAQQWFQLHTRIFTIICGIVLAFLLQLDTAEIFRFVSTNATARAALAASADKLVDKADGILEKNGSLLERIYETVKNKVSKINLPKDVRTAAANSAALKKAIQDDTTPNLPTDFDTKYEAAEKEAIDAYYKDRRAQMDDLTKGLAASGFNLLPNRLWHRWDSGNEIDWGRFASHLWGMLITAGLLSLGAPYWYNILKNLTSLRPAVAKLIGEEKAAEKKTR